MYPFFMFLFSCEDIINPDLPTNDPILVVDAWINNLEETQVIKLSKTQNYLDTNSPVPVVGANVFVYDENSKHFTLYSWDSRVLVIPDQMGLQETLNLCSIIDPA